jgi:hypothetical protein
MGIMPTETGTHMLLCGNQLIGAGEEAAFGG